MSLDISKSLEIIEIMENYISDVRPEPEIRDKLDLAYEIDNLSVILNQIRPFWDDPSRIMAIGYAKATYVKGSDLWKVYWKRADNKWHSYKPVPIVMTLKDFLGLVDEDKYGCFGG